jgi:hypothetical protein
MPSLDLLYQLDHLDQSSPRFSDGLLSLLEKRECIEGLENDDLARLVEHLDTVRLRIVLTNPQPKRM